MDGKSWEEESPFYIELKFKSRAEAQGLAEELKRWTPQRGWSDEAEALFNLLLQGTIARY